jgi:hypothetical protein
VIVLQLRSRARQPYGKKIIIRIVGSIEHEFLNLRDGKNFLSSPSYLCSGHILQAEFPGLCPCRAFND